MIHASINIFADSAESLHALYRHVGHCMQNGEGRTEHNLRHESDLFHNGCIHFVMDGQPVPSERIEEGDIIFQTKDALQGERLVVPACTLGKVLHNDDERLSILYSTNTVVVYERDGEWRDTFARVTYNAFLDDRSEEFLRLEALVATHFEVRQQTEHDAARDGVDDVA